MDTQPSTTRRRTPPPTWRWRWTSAAGWWPRSSRISGSRRRPARNGTCGSSSTTSWSGSSCSPACCAASRSSRRSRRCAPSATGWATTHPPRMTRARRRLLAAFTAPGVLERLVRVPFGTVPGAVARHLRIIECLVHGWISPPRSGLPFDPPAELVEREIAFTGPLLGQVPPERHVFAPSRPPPTARRRSSGWPPCSGVTPRMSDAEQRFADLAERVRRRGGRRACRARGSPPLRVRGPHRQRVDLRDAHAGASSS